MANVTSITTTIYMSITQLRARFSEACAMVENGDKVIITKHGFPYMRLIPIAANPSSELHQKPAKPEEPNTTA